MIDSQKSTGWAEDEWQRPIWGTPKVTD